MKMGLKGFMIGLLVVWVVPAWGQDRASNALGQAWKHFNQGRYTEAAMAFQIAAGDGRRDISQNARLGLAYVRIRQSRLTAAEKILRLLAAENYRPEETLMQLVQVRLALNDPESAADAAKGLPEPRRTQMNLKIADARLQAAFSKRLDTPSDAETFLTTFPKELAECRRPDLFFKAAVKAAEGSASTCVPVYEKLLTCPLPDPLRQGVLENLGWYYYNQSQFSSAENYFKQLKAERPGHRGAVLGLGYIYLNSNKPAAALKTVQTADGVADDPEILELRRLIYLRIGWRHYHDGAFQTAAQYARKAFDIQPENLDTRLLLAWIDLKNGEVNSALNVFERVFQAHPTPENAKQLLDAQVAAGQMTAAGKTAETLALSQTPQMRRYAADFFFDQGETLRAACIFNDDTCCYRNADAMQFQTHAYYRHRSGDAGTSKLDAKAVDLEMVAAWGAKTRFSWGVTPGHLDSGNGAAAPVVGRYDRYLDSGDRFSDLGTDETVWSPHAGLQTEGAVRWSLYIGTTPVGGAVSPTPIGHLRLATDTWHVALHRCTVSESILSISGLDDPYSGESWGRVVRSGVSAGYVLALGERFWFSGTIAGDRYDGRQIWENDRLGMDLSTGGTWQTRQKAIYSAGLFLTAQGFRRNSQFFTFGHGGYYSPALMTMTGPFIRYQTPICRRYGFDLQAAMGWLHEETDDSPRYPLLKNANALLTSAARDDAAGWYAGKTSNGLGYSLRAEGSWLVSKHLAMGVFATANNSSDYAEWLIGLSLHCFFKPQTRLWQRWSPVGHVDGCLLSP